MDSLGLYKPPPKKAKLNVDPENPSENEFYPNKSSKVQEVIVELTQEEEKANALKK